MANRYLVSLEYSVYLDSHLNFEFKGINKNYHSYLVQNLKILYLVIAKVEKVNITVT